MGRRDPIVVTASESIKPEQNEIRFLDSGRIELALAGDRVILLREPTVAEFYSLDGVYVDLVNEARDAPEGELRQELAKDIGGRWLTHVIRVLGAASLPEYDSQTMPAWASKQHAQIRQQIQEHWLTVPFRSGPRSNGFSVSTTPTVAARQETAEEAMAAAARFLPGAIPT